MLTPAFVNILTFFYPIGNTPAVSLTQSIPPNVPADILLLGCGDVRSILFTSYTSNRKMDITCCDSQKAVIARNILLLSLIIDENDGQTNEYLWDIHYHMYIEDKALGVLRSHAKKLYALSASMDTWRASKYGSLLTFCDFVTLADVRKMWAFYSIERTGAESLRFKHRFDSVIKEARDYCSQSSQGIVLTGTRSAIPAHLDTIEDLNALRQHYWKYGSTEFNADIRKAAKHPNPTLLALDREAIIHYGTDPLLGFHLATAYVTLHPDDPVSQRINKLPRLQKVVTVARMEFTEWIASYKKQSNNIRLRFFTGDAISLAYALQHMRVTTSSTSQWYRNRYGFQLLALDGPDYATSVAPLDFDVIDTSNLCDHLGSLALLTATSPLLRNHAASVLYTEVLVKKNQTYQEALDDIVCGHVPSLSTLLDLFPIEYWTNTSSISPGDEMMLATIMDGLSRDKVIGTERQQMFLRTSWKRSLPMTPSREPYPKQTRIQFDANELAKTLYQVYCYMFRDEDYAYKFANLSIETLFKSSLVWYHRASFASFLRLVQTRVTCDWDAAMSKLMDLVEHRPNAPMGMQYFQELCVHLHIMGVFSFPLLRCWNDRNERSAISTAMMLTYPHTRVTPLNEKWGDLRDWENIPSVVCVTLKIPRSKLGVFTDLSRGKISTPYVHCLLEGASSWQNIFSACQLAFGDISTRGKPYDDSFEVSVAEDDAGWSGTSPLLAVFYVPALFLLLEPGQTKIAFGIHSTPGTVAIFASKLGLTLNVYETNVDNSAAVYITRYGPNQSRFPVATGFAQKPPTTAACIGSDASLMASVDEGTGHIVTFTSRLNITTEESKLALKNGCQVEKSIVSPCEIAIQLGQTAPQTLLFPVFIVETPQKIRIARKSSYVEVVAHVAGPSEWTRYPTYMYPIHLQHGKPINRNVQYLNLRTCPTINIDERSNLGWLNPHLSFMMSAKERTLRETKGLSRSDGEQLRLDFKESLFSIFVHFSGLQGNKHHIFGLNNAANGGIHILILASDLRINLSDRAVVIDCAVLPLHDAIMPGVRNFLQHCSSQGIVLVHVNDAELQLWRRVLPAYVERCRTWDHGANCEYKNSDKIPLSIENNKQLLCTCGNGNFPANFITNVPHWEALAKYAVRAAISPAFWSPFADDIYRPDIGGIMASGGGRPNGNGCACCGKKKREDGGDLLNCAQCMKVKYCSRHCQKVDWPEHKTVCKGNK
ncbi:hypothetical protein F4803DRAFT_571387 [Xylaria telfairii]|nr:hypothetical protein F4803DRAFT_571387 [Xylaria telfairii]